MKRFILTLLLLLSAPAHALTGAYFLWCETDPYTGVEVCAWVWEWGVEPPVYNMSEEEVNLARGVIYAQWRDADRKNHCGMPDNLLIAHAEVLPLVDEAINFCSNSPDLDCTMQRDNADEVTWLVIDELYSCKGKKK